MCYFTVSCTVQCVCVYGCSYMGAPCGQALFTTPEQATLSLTSDLESDKDRLCCLCGRTERTQSLSIRFELHTRVSAAWWVYERQGTLIPTANDQIHCLI